MKQLIADIPRETTVVMIEHDMDTALDLAENITVLHYGSVIVEGTRAESSPIRKRARSILATEALALSGINALYGDSHVLHDVSFALDAGRVLALLGRNGAGKTTCMSTIIGFLPPRDGEIRLVRRIDHAACRRRRFRARASASCRRGGGFSRRSRCAKT